MSDLRELGERFFLSNTCCRNFVFENHKTLQRKQRGKHGWGWRFRVKSLSCGVNLDVLKILNAHVYVCTTRNRPLEHQIFWQHHVFGCNSWFYCNQRINALRYLGVMATKNVGCVCWNSCCNRLVLMPRWKWWLPLWVAIATTDLALR
jgi:hypothetical protein